MSDASDDVARILICDDSAPFTQGLTRFLQRDPDLRVVAKCSSAEQMLEQLPRAKPDLVTVDLELEGMHGIDAVREIMRRHPMPVLVLSAHVGRGSELAAAALGAGALEAQPKDEITLDGADSAAARAFRRRVKRLARARVPGSGRRMSQPPPRAAGGHRAAAIGICSSTGGPAALTEILSALPGDFPLPIFVVQHIAQGFIAGLAEWLDGKIALPVALARDGRRAPPGVWLAPDRAHLLVGHGLRMRLGRRASPGYHCPAGDVLLTSMGESLGAEAVSVVLTGMGEDGAAGTAAVRAAGGLTIAQDEETSAIYGMPRAAAERGAKMVLPLPAIAGALRTLTASERTP